LVWEKLSGMEHRIQAAAYTQYVMITKIGGVLDARSRSLGPVGAAHLGH
jgi:hypothetical protein